MPSIWVNDASTGTCTLPDGRTVKFNGSSIAAVSDGSSIYVGGKGPVSVLDGSVTSFSLSQSSGQTVSLSIQVSAFSPAVPDLPSGNVAILINGVSYTTATLDANGLANVAIPSGAFSGAGTYSLSVAYSGDGNYAPSSAAPQPFAFSQLTPTVVDILIPTSGLSTTDHITISPGVGNPIPTGTVTIFINGVQYTMGTLDGTGHVNISLPQAAFSGGGGGFFAIKCLYNGDSNYTTAQDTQTFHYTGS